MGNLLGSPVTEKETSTGWTPDGKLQYGLSSMQGWRVHMEDAHINQPFLFAEVMDNSGTNENSGKLDSTSSNSDEISAKKQKNNEEVSSAKSASSSRWTQIPVPNHSLYAVFDGHGGSFAAEYAGRNFCRVLSRTSHFVQYAQHIQKETATMNATEQANHRTEGIALLEASLTDAFVEIDKEIFLHVRHEASVVTDANVLYGIDYEHKEVTQLNKILEKESTNIQNETIKTQSLDQQHADEHESGIKTNSRSHQHDVHSVVPEPNDGEDSGTTAVIVIVTPHNIVCANAGDSRAVYSKFGHKAVPLSYDHKPDDEAEERRIRDGGGFVSAGRVEGDLAVSRGLGDYRFKIPDAILGAKMTDSNSFTENSTNRFAYVDEQKVTPMPDIVVQNRNENADEFIMVACDGIWDVQTNHECVQMVASIFEEGESDIGLVCEEVLDICLDRGSKDNMTALIVKMPAQKIGIGGGVKARRQVRAEEEKKRNLQLENDGSQAYA